MYREHGTSSLPRDIAALYADTSSDAARDLVTIDWAAAWSTWMLPRPSGDRCRTCGYRLDAAGHTVTCG